VNKHALIDRDGIDFSDNESITEDDAADTTLGVDVRNGKSRVQYTGNLPKLRLRWNGSKCEKEERRRHEENPPVDSDFDLIRYGRG
jgi:hypothetical protein